MDANYERRAGKRPLDLIQNNKSSVQIQQEGPSTELQFYLNRNWQLVYNLDCTAAEPPAISNSSENQVTRQPIEAPVQHVSQPVLQPKPCSPLILYGQVCRQQPHQFSSSSSSLRQKLVPRRPQQRQPSAYVKHCLTPSSPLCHRNYLSRAHPTENSLNISSSEAVPSLNQTAMIRAALQARLRRVLASGPLEKAGVGQLSMSTLDCQNMLRQQPEVPQNMPDLNKNSPDFSSSGAEPSLNQTRRNVRAAQHELQLPQILARGLLEQAGRLLKSTLDRQMMLQQSQVLPEDMQAGSAPVRRRSKDPGWKYVKIVKRGQRTLLKCNLCGKECFNSITRMKRHLAGTSTDITACPMAPARVRQEMRNAVRPAPPRCIPSSRRGA